MRFNRNTTSEVSGRTSRSYWLGLAVAVVAVLATACSSSANSASGSAGASGGTINIGEIADLTGPSTFPGGIDGLKTAVAAVNKAGGINGHLVNLVTCDTQGNPNVATECANQMVSDHVVYVSTDSVQGDSFLPVLHSAGIPVTMGGGVGSDALSFSNSYILGSGDLSTAGAGAMCAKLGSTKIGIAQLDIAGLTPQVNSLYQAIAPFGLTRANTNITLIPPTAVDMSTYAAALVQRSTCIVEILSPNQSVPLVAAIHSQNRSIPVVAPGSATEAQWKVIGKLADNVCDNAPMAPAELTAVPGMSQYNAEMDTYNGSGLRDRHSVIAWASVQLAAKLLAQVSDPTAATYMRALNTDGTISVPPLPPLNFAHPINLIPGITRLMSEDVVFYHYINGGEVAPFYGGKFVNILNLKSEPPIPTAPHC